MKIDVMLDEGAKMPTKAHETDAGFDMYTPYEVTVKAHGSAVIDTMTHMLIPTGYVGMLKSKSGLNVNHSLTSEGVIDAGYTGSIIAKLYNNSDKDYTFEAYSKITQIVILPIPETWLNQVAELTVETERGNKGFGSSGM